MVLRSHTATACLLRALRATLALALMGVSRGAGETRTLALATVQPVYTGDVEASGRLVPQFAATVGSRLTARITTWGTTAAGEPVDVGTQVQEGDLLFAVDPRTFAATVESAQAALATAKALLADVQAGTRPEQIAALRATLAEWDARLPDRQRDEERYRRLVEVDRTVPAKRLEEATLELAVARSQRAAAQARLDEAVAGPTSTQIALAECRVREAETALAAALLDVQDTEVRAPFDGVITRRLKGLGDHISGAPFVGVLELVSANRIEAELHLPEALLPQVVPGQTPVLLSSSLGPPLPELPVTRVIRQVDTDSGTFAIRVAIPPDQAKGLVPGAFVTARLRPAGGSAGALVPLGALVEERGKTGVLVAQDGRMVRHEVEVGSRLTEGAVVRDGVKAGDLVVVGPAEELRDGAPLPEYLLKGR
jgi:HlyD family secretion protein